jgi:hypothetical protein
MPLGIQVQVGVGCSSLLINSTYIFRTTIAWLLLSTIRTLQQNATCMLHLDPPFEMDFIKLESTPDLYVYTNNKKGLPYLWVPPIPNIIVLEQSCLFLSPEKFWYKTSPLHYRECHGFYEQAGGPAQLGHLPAGTSLWTAPHKPFIIIQDMANIRIDS